MENVRNVLTFKVSSSACGKTDATTNLRKQWRREDLLLYLLQTLNGNVRLLFPLNLKGLNVLFLISKKFTVTFEWQMQLFSNYLHGHKLNY